MLLYEYMYLFPIGPIRISVADTIFPQIFRNYIIKQFILKLTDNQIYFTRKIIYWVYFKVCAGFVIYFHNSLS